MRAPCPWTVCVSWPIRSRLEANQRLICEESVEAQRDQPCSRGANATSSESVGELAALLHDLCSILS